MDKIEKIRKEIERLKDAVTTTIKELRMPEPNERMCGELDAYDDVLWFLDTLEKEPDKSLEEEMDKFFETMPVLEHENIFEDIFKNIARHFANWQKEQMLKEAIDGEISSVDAGDDSYVKTIKMPELRKAIRNYNLGDKVHIIIVKED